MKNDRSKASAATTGSNIAQGLAVVALELAPVSSGTRPIGQGASRFFGTTALSRVGFEC
jgi:hypothetical protein